VVRGKDETQMNIVYALTSNYVHKAIPSMTSLLEHNPQAHIFLLTETDTVDLPFNVEVINVSDQKWFTEEGVNFKNYFTYINLLKVCYAEILPVDKVIHLDADTIICDSLDPMWDVDLTGKWFASVPEYYGAYKPFGNMYFNMGVSVINLKQMREDDIIPTMVKYLNTVPQPWADQDAWNLYALWYNKALALAVRYNENAVCGFTDEPAIIHYCANKNWWDDKTMYRREYLDRYR
jgi:lipopolysaccharide biosynthesis glycosyltransferase